MVESWKGDAEGMLIFVRLQTTSHTSAYNLEIVDRFILCCSRGIARTVRPESPAEPTGHLIFLPRKYLSATFYPTKWVPNSHPVELIRPHSTVHSSRVGRLGQRALVYESGHQSDLRPIGDIDTAMGASVRKSCQPPLFPSQTSTHSHFL